MFVLQIAALSPADINFEETLSTLRYGESMLLHCFSALQPSYALALENIMLQSILPSSKCEKHMHDLVVELFSCYIVLNLSMQ